MIPYSPALDGLRAVCLLAVLLFHSSFEWMSGGFLGVSTFFTLSGYLITTLLLREWREAGSLDLRAFWDRRLRRLGPALWGGVCLALAIAATGTSEKLRSTAGDAISSLLYWSNWRFMAPEYSYALLFESPSALQHTWSLSIEAQFYLVFPLVLGATLLARSGLRLAAAAVGSLIALSVWAAFIDATDGDAVNRAYYGTLSRAAEPLAGAALALWLERPQKAPLGVVGQALGIVAAIAMIVLWSQSQVVSPWLYQGGFAFHAILSASVLHSALHEGSLLQKSLSLLPLPWLGRLSYGAYVYHWPIFLYLTEERVGMSGGALFALRTAVTIAAAQLSLVLIEQPVRHRRYLPGLGAVASVSVAVPLLIAAATQWVAPSHRAPVLTQEIDVTKALGRPPRVSIFGDSTALRMARHLNPWLREAGIETPRGRALLGCSIINRGQRFHWNQWRPEHRRCADLLTKWDTALQNNTADIAIVMVGPWEVLDRRLDDSDTVRAFGDPVFDEAFLQAATATVETFRRHGVKIAWVASPPIQNPQKNWSDMEALARANDPARMARMNDLLRTLQKEFPDRIRIIDLAEHVATAGIDLAAPGIRSDGIHFTQEAMTNLVENWLGPQAVFAVNDLIEGG